MSENEMIDIINGILEDVNEDILSYEGNNMMEDGIVDSFEIISIVGDLEEAFNMEIDAEYIEQGYFDSKQGIYKLVGMLLLK